MLGLFARHKTVAIRSDARDDAEEDRRLLLDGGRDKATWAEDDQRWDERERVWLKQRSDWLTEQGRLAATSPTTRRDVEDEFNFYYLLPRH